MDRPNFVYVLWRDSDGAHKIGQSINPWQRMRDQQRELGCQMKIVALLERPLGDALNVEQSAHFALWRYRLDGEWFSAKLKAIFAAVEFAASQEDIRQFQLRRLAAVDAIEAEWGRRPTRDEIRELQRQGRVPEHV